MSKPNTFTCYKCNKDIPVIGAFKIQRTEDCPYCTASLHCCKMCKFYDQKVYNECKESNAERIVDKEKANFCDYFVLLGEGNSGLTQEDLLKNALSIFKN